MRSSQLLQNGLSYVHIFFSLLVGLLMFSFFKRNVKVFLIGSNNARQSISRCVETVEMEVVVSIAAALFLSPPVELRVLPFSARTERLELEIALKRKL